MTFTARENSIKLFWGVKVQGFLVLLNKIADKTLLHSPPNLFFSMILLVNFPWMVTQNFAMHDAVFDY